MFGIGTEDPVNAAAVEAEPSQGSLQIYDVVSPKVRRRQLQQSVTEAPTCLYEGRPGRFVALAGLGQIP